MSKYIRGIDKVGCARYVIKDGEPCNHTGCLNHISHPCEGCGRIGGKSNVIQIITREKRFINYKKRSEKGE